MAGRLFSLFLFAWILTGCSQVGALASKLNPGKKAGNTDGVIPPVPAELRGRTSTDVREDDVESTVIDAGVDPATLGLQDGGIAGLARQDELIFTDPDDPDASEALLKGLLSGKKKEWLSSHSVAKNLALNEAKPLLIFFADSPGGGSAGSPLSAKLEKELLARLDFAEWAGEHFIRLKLEYNVAGRRSADSKKQSLALEKEKYLASLKKRYKVRGYPTMLVVSTDGSVIQNIRGYRSGGYNYTWGLLKTALVQNEKRQKDFEEKLAKKGYRHWSGKNDNRIFARLASYRDGKITLIAPNGTRYETSEESLSAEDVLWIEGERRRRRR